MKKTLKKLSSIICMIALLVIASVSVACGGGKPTTNSIDASQTNITDNGNSQIENVESDEEATDETETPEIQIELNGIYKFEKTYSFDDVYFEDLNEVLEFFKTRDINGVYDASKKLGFDEFVNNITNTETLSRALLFNSNVCYNLSYTENNIYKFVDEDLNFEYIITDDGKITTNNTSIIEYDQETDRVVIYFMFKYENNGEIIETPLYVKTSLTKVDYSTDINSGLNYIYNKNSLVLKTTSTESISFDEYNEILSNIFNVAEGENLNDKMLNTLSSWTLNINEDMSTIIVTFADNSFAIIHIDNNNSYTINNVTFKITERINDITTNSKILVMEVTLDSETSLCFEFIEK